MNCTGITLIMCALGAMVVYTPAIRLSAVMDTTLELGSMLGSFQYLLVGKGQDFGKKRFVIQFENMTSNCTEVVSAVMYLQYGYAHKAEWIPEEPVLTRQLCTYQILRTWDEATTGGTTYMTAGSDYVANCMDFVTLITNESIEGQLSNGFVPFDITEAARSWVRGVANYGILVLDLNEDLDGRDRRFWSREAAPDIRPYVEVICSSNVTGNVSVEGSGCSNTTGSADIPTVGALATTACIMTIVILVNSVILWMLLTRRRKTIVASMVAEGLPAPSNQVINIAVNNEYRVEQGHCEASHLGAAEKRCDDSTANAYHDPNSVSAANQDSAADSVYYDVIDGNLLHKLRKLDSDYL